MMLKTLYFVYILVRFLLDHTGLVYNILGKIYSLLYIVNLLIGDNVDFLKLNIENSTLIFFLCRLTKHKIISVF